MRRAALAIALMLTVPIADGEIDMPVCYPCDGGDTK